jgi:hypothetical protein
MLLYIVNCDNFATNNNRKENSQMKKVLSLLLAVVLVCSMATVALAGNPVKTCKFCGFTTTDAAEYNAHMFEDCGFCGYCGNGFESAKILAEHKYICDEANIKCDYCGNTIDSESNFDSHIGACKKNHFYIPLALIIEHAKAFFGKLDFKKIIAEGKSFFGYVGTIGKDVAGAVK